MMNIIAEMMIKIPAFVAAYERAKIHAEIAKQNEYLTENMKYSNELARERAIEQRAKIQDLEFKLACM